MSSARLTYSDRLLLVMASRYRSMARFILAISVFQVSGWEVPSSKKERGIVAACGRLKPALVKDVAEASTGVGPAWDDGIDKLGLMNGSVPRRNPDATPAIESMDGEGEIPMPPSLVYARLFFRGGYEIMRISGVEEGKECQMMSTYQRSHGAHHR